MTALNPLLIFEVLADLLHLQPITDSPSSPTSSASSSTDELCETSNFDISDSPDDPSPLNETVEERTVRKGKDYRYPSTFWKKPKEQQTGAERLCAVATCPREVYIVKDETFDRGPVGTIRVLDEHLFILPRALVPICLQSLSYWAFPGFKWPMALAYPVYFISFVMFAIAVLRHLDAYCVKFGTFDEKNFGRDRTPDIAVNQLARGIMIYMLVRTGMDFFLNYNKDVNPLLSFTWTYPIRLALWEVTLDYFFYVYHRACHEFDFLWFIHRHHHMTKHPTPILAILAGDYQEVLEIALIPLAASLLVPMSFAELYLTMAYTIYVEMLGHSGIRASSGHPVLCILKAVGMELMIEDHDLHHRMGKSGVNYGKQSRVWDKLFGTAGDRIETAGM